MRGDGCWEGSEIDGVDVEERSCWLGRNDAVRFISDLLHTLGTFYNDRGCGRISLLRLLQQTRGTKQCTALSLDLSIFFP